MPEIATEMMLSKTDIKTLTASIIEDRSKTKLIPDLIVALDDETKLALNGLVKVFTKLIRKGDLKAADASASDNNAEDPVLKYSKWLCQVFDEALKKITSMIKSESWDF